MIILKSPGELECMRRSGRLLAQVFELLEEEIRPGVSTEELDRLCEDWIRSAGAQPSFKGYRGFPASICVSINDEVVHGIPSSRLIGSGDILSVDIGLVLDGYHADSAMTFACGSVTCEAKRLIQVTREALGFGIAQCNASNRLSDVSHAIQCHVEAAGFSVVRDFVGHGIGRSMHEDPQVPNFGNPGFGPRLKPGMVLAIEPMVNAGRWQVVVQDNGWTVTTSDGSLSAHFEHTVAVTEEGPEILTILQ